MMYTASSDGKLCFTDIDSGTPAEVLDLNPDGWAVSFSILRLALCPSEIGS